jgi:hypothetical protein
MKLLHYSERNHKEKDMTKSMCQFQAKVNTLQTEKLSQPKYKIHYDGISFKLCIPQLVHHAMKSG